mgnify:CR=1 FL=1
MKYSDEQFLKFAESKYPSTRAFIAKNKDCPFFILEMLAMDVNKDVQCGVAWNYNCPDYILDLLSRRGTFFDVKIAVAEHKNTSIATLEKLAINKYWQVRDTVALNKNSNENILLKIYNYNISNNYGNYGSEILIKNKNCPFYILKEIYKKSNEIMKNNIKNHPNWKLNDFE